MSGVCVGVPPTTATIKSALAAALAQSPWLKGVGLGPTGPAVPAPEPAPAGTYEAPVEVAEQDASLTELLHRTGRVPAPYNNVIRFTIGSLPAHCMLRYTAM